MTKKRTFPLGALLWMGGGTAFALGSISLKVGTWHNPGPGFTPFLTGILLALSGLALLLQGLTGSEKTAVSLAGAFRNFGRERIFCLLAVALYALLLEPLGFVPAAFLLLFALFKILEPRKWLSPLLGSSLAVLLSYLVFDVWLRINFPKGIWIRITGGF